MSKCRVIGAGAGIGRASGGGGYNTGGDQGGGNKKQGLIGTTNRRVELVPFIRTRSDGGNSRNWVFCMNQLGGVGRRWGQAAGPGNRGGVGPECHYLASLSRRHYPATLPQGSGYGPPSTFRSKPFYPRAPPSTTPTCESLGCRKLKVSIPTATLVHFGYDALFPPPAIEAPALKLTSTELGSLTRLTRDYLLIGNDEHIVAAAQTNLTDITRRVNLAPPVKMFNRKPSSGKGSDVIVWAVIYCAKGLFSVAFITGSKYKHLPHAWLERVPAGDLASSWLFDSRAPARPLLIRAGDSEKSTMSVKLRPVPKVTIARRNVSVSTAGGDAAATQMTAAYIQDNAFSYKDNPEGTVFNIEQTVQELLDMGVDSIFIASFLFGGGSGVPVGTLYQLLYEEAGNQWKDGTEYNKDAAQGKYIDVSAMKTNHPEEYGQMLAAIKGSILQEAFGIANETDSTGEITLGALNRLARPTGATTWKLLKRRLLSAGGSAQGNWTVFGPGLQTPNGPKQNAVASAGCPCGYGGVDYNPPDMGGSTKTYDAGTRDFPPFCSSGTCQSYMTLSGCAPPTQGQPGTALNVDYTTCTSGIFHDIVKAAEDAKDGHPSEASQPCDADCGKPFGFVKGECKPTDPTVATPSGATSCEEYHSPIGCKNAAAQCTWDASSTTQTTVRGTGAYFGIASNVDQNLAWRLENQRNTGEQIYDQVHTLYSGIPGYPQTKQNPWRADKRANDTVYFKSGVPMCYTAPSTLSEYIPSEYSVVGQDPKGTQDRKIFDPTRTAWLLVTLIRTLGFNGIDWDIEQGMAGLGTQVNLQMVISAMHLLCEPPTNTDSSADPRTNLYSEASGDFYNILTILIGQSSQATWTTVINPADCPLHYPGQEGEPTLMKQWLPKLSGTDIVSVINPKLQVYKDDKTKQGNLTPEIIMNLFGIPGLDQIVLEESLKTFHWSFVNFMLYYIPLYECTCDPTNGNDCNGSCNALGWAASAAKVAAGDKGIVEETVQDAGTACCLSALPKFLTNKLFGTDGGKKTGLTPDKLCLTVTVDATDTDEDLNNSNTKYGYASVEFTRKLREIYDENIIGGFSVWWLPGVNQPCVSLQAGICQTLPIMTNKEPSDTVRNWANGGNDQTAFPQIVQNAFPGGLCSGIVSIPAVGPVKYTVCGASGAYADANGIYQHEKARGLPLINEPIAPWASQVYVKQGKNGSDTFYLYAYGENEEGGNWVIQKGPDTPLITGACPPPPDLPEPEDQDGWCALLAKQCSQFDFSDKEKGCPGCSGSSTSGPCSDCCSSRFNDLWKQQSSLCNIPKKNSCTDPAGTGITWKDPAGNTVSLTLTRTEPGGKAPACSTGTSYQVSGNPAVNGTYIQASTGQKAPTTSFASHAYVLQGATDKTATPTLWSECDGSECTRPRWLLSYVDLTSGAPNIKATPQNPVYFVVCTDDETCKTIPQTLRSDTAGADPITVTKSP